MLSKMKIKTKDIITESLKTDGEVVEVDMLNEKNILNSDIQDIYIKYIGEST